MLQYFLSVMEAAYYYAVGMDRMQFLVVSVVVLVFGLFCLRGDGERI